MSLEQLFHRVESHLYNIGQQIYRDHTAELLDEEHELSAELVREEASLQAVRDEMQESRQRLKQTEAEAAHLASRVETYLHVHDGPNAYQHAMRLDDARRTIAGDRVSLRRALRRERDHLERIDELEARLKTIRARLIKG
jgi:hypothetical protein